MKYLFINRGLPAGNPIANLFVILVGTVIIAVSIVVGFVAFLILGAIVAVLAAGFGLRVWWLKRGLKRRHQTGGANSEARSGGVIEGEFRVVEDQRDEHSGN